MSKTIAIGSILVAALLSGCEQTDPIFAKRATQAENICSEKHDQVMQDMIDNLDGQVATFNQLPDDYPVKPIVIGMAVDQRRSTFLMYQMIVLLCHHD